MPNTLNIYETAAQLRAIDLMPPEYSFLFDTFCKDMGVSEEDKAIMDYRKGKRRMAPVVHEGTGGVVMERDGFETRAIEFCTIAPERLITNHDIKSRAFGENILGGMTPEQRAKKMLAKDLVEMRQATQRRREWMGRQVLLNGKLSVFRYTSEGRDMKTTALADFGFTQYFTSETAWSGVGADIDADMREIFDIVYEGSGAVDVIVMAPDVANAMLANSTYIKKYELVNAEIAKLNIKYKGQGVRYLGMNTDGVEMYSMSGKFTDDDGIDKAILPSGTLIAGSKEMLKVEHGPVTQVEDPGATALPKTYVKKEVPLRYGDIAAGSVKNRLTSRPMILPENVDGWVVAHVL